MTRHLHLPHPHIADRVAEAFEHALHHGLGHHPPPLPKRTVPPADDWNDWHYEREDGVL